MGGNPTDQSFNRRNVLKGIAAGSAASIGLSTEALAVEPDPTDEHLQRVLEHPKTKSIREAVGGFEVEDSTVTRTDTSEPLVATEIETDVGRLLHAEKGGKTQVKLDFHSLSENPKLRERLPKDHRDVPKETQISIIVHSGSVKLVRTVTDRELRRLKSKVDVEFDTFGAVYQSDIDGYGITVETSAGTVKQFQVEAPISNDQVQSVETKPQVTALQGGVTTQGECENTCLTCAAAAASKGICYASCAFVVALPGAILCAACIVTSSIGLISCAQCCDCAGC